ncbi:MAG: hypothetical protein H6707_18765 [Deltaproteobacteria bacterium]|nr:hypothetical protein [Deltaproteobacteria bacterium]
MQVAGKCGPHAARKGDAKTSEIARHDRTRTTAWVHTLCGKVNLNDIVLTQGDGIGVTNERSVSFTVQEDTEVLLVDIGPTKLPPWAKQSP